ncbi:cold-shock protein [Jannaschia sp. R86511]|uniref:cold-shock protein n=1 Tax=Jannaschia sp. R86511 TaxID=3093853 RepID=UPI0036D39882
MLGTVAWYEPGKGYGFVTPDDGGPEVFVHSSAVVAGAVVTEGQRVAFLVVPGEKGPQAEHVLPLAAAAAATAPVAAADGADGTVSWYDEDKGFGFITPDVGSEDVFVHVRSLAGGVALLAEGDRVRFDVVQGDRGPQARDVQPLRGAAGRDAAGRDAGGRGAGGRGAPERGRPSRPSGRDVPDRGAPVRGGEGVVARYDAERGFGFITPDAGGADLFVHVSSLNGADALLEGDRVRYKVRQSDRGPQADRVEPA